MQTGNVNEKKPYIYQPYPKWVSGVLVRSAEEEAKLAPVVVEPKPEIIAPPAAEAQPEASEKRSGRVVRVPRAK